MNKKNFYLLFGVLAVIGVVIVFIFVFAKPSALSDYDICGAYRLEKAQKGNKQIDYSGIDFYYCFYEDGTGEINFDTVISSFTYSVEKKEEKTYLTIYSNNDVINQYLLSINEEEMTITRENTETLYLKKAEDYMPMVNTKEASEETDKEITKYEAEEFIKENDDTN